MAHRFSNDDHFQGSITSSAELFMKMQCHSANANTNRVKMEDLDEDMMRCHILDCLVAIRRLEREKRVLKISGGNEPYECAKRRIFKSSVSMILDEQRPIESDQRIFSLLLQPFPDEDKNTDGRSWLTMHFATALGNKVAEDDIHEVHSADPLSIQRYDLLKPDLVAPFSRRGKTIFVTRYTPCHFLCMQRYPSLSLVKYLSMRDLRAFTICAIKESNYSVAQRDVCNAIQLAAASSESVELLRILLQVDQSMIKKPTSIRNGSLDISASPLSRLCKRSASQFSTFNGMLECLMAADNSSEILNEGILSSFESYGKSDSTDIKALLALIETLLEADKNAGDRSKIFPSACSLLNGELCIAVLSLLLSKYNAGAGLRLRNRFGYLPVQTAVSGSTLDVVKFLLQADPESAKEITIPLQYNLLHFAISGDTATNIAKIQYLSEQYPELLHMSSRGYTPLQMHIVRGKLNFSLIKIMCQADETVLSNKCMREIIFQPFDYDGMLPLHILLMEHMPGVAVLSLESDIFRFVLHRYPAAVGVRDSEDQNAYDLAKKYGVDDYFIRLLLDADRSVEPERRLDLNHKARKEALFLSYRALSTDTEPIIWIKLRNESRDLLRHTISYL